MSHPGSVSLRPEQVRIPPGHAWNRLPMIAGGLAIAGAIGCAILGMGNPKQFLFSWLVSWLFFLSLALGGLFFVLIQYAAQGGWGIVVRRIGETTFATLPVLAVLFIPLLFGLRELYSWAVPGAAEHDPLLHWKEPFLNVPFFLIRARVLFRGLVLHRLDVLPWFAAVRTSPEILPSPPGSGASPGPRSSSSRVTLTFASIDWIMSLTPHWYSTMFGVYFFAGSFVGFIAFLSVVERRDALGGAPGHGHQRRPSARCRQVPVRVHGVLGLHRLLAVLPHVVREHAGGDDLLQGPARRLLEGGLGLSDGRPLRRSVPVSHGSRRQAAGSDAGAWRRLAPRHALPGSLLAGHADAPSRRDSVSALDIAAFVTIGGCFVASASWLMRRQALVPIRDPRLAESLAFENL